MRNKGIDHQEQESSRSFLVRFISLIVILVISVIGIKISWHNHRVHSEKLLVEQLSSLRTSISEYKKQTGQFPETLDKLVDAKLLKELPRDPILQYDYVQNLNNVPLNRIQLSKIAGTVRQGGWIYCGLTGEVEVNIMDPSRANQMQGHYGQGWKPLDINAKPYNTW